MCYDTPFDMKLISPLNTSKKVLALSLIGLSLLLPVNALAAVVQPASAPITIPVPIPGINAPEMDYPQNGQTIDLEGAYMFKVKPVTGASGYLFGLFQNNVMVYENLRDGKSLSPNGEFALRENSPFHAKFKAGSIKVMIRALINGQWSNAREITINLKPRPIASPTSTPIATPSQSPNPISSPSATARPSATPFPKPAPVTVRSILPTQLRLGKVFIIFGNGFGRGGKINFYKLNQTAASGSATNIFWSNSLIFGLVPSYIQGNQFYGLQVRTEANGSRDSALVYRYISR